MTVAAPPEYEIGLMVSKGSYSEEHGPILPDIRVFVFHQPSEGDPEIIAERSLTMSEILSVADIVPRESVAPKPEHICHADPLAMGWCDKESPVRMAQATLGELAWSHRSSESAQDRR